MGSNRIMVAAVLVLSAMSAACTRTVVYKESEKGPVLIDEKNGPPDHAPAYGYRRNHPGQDDVVLVYDTTLKVYVVSGYDECYYSAGQYFRFVSARWEWSVSLGSTWKLVANDRHLPPGLRHHHGKANGHDKDDDEQ
ncbi:MAG TPA: hypothetical protein VFH33_03345 [Candidatus Krumholzibacteria bacterium]|nr:hypothetical protein [Candidatus Krumholzibacteria bacterium]